MSPTLDSSDDPRCSAQEAAHTKLGICVMSPTDIVLLDETDEILAKLGAHNWCKPETLNADELRLAGNKCFAAKDFGGSLKLYERALRLQPDAAVLLLNKSAALLKLERFSEAYSVAEKALHAGADKEKALFRYYCLTTSCRVKLCCSEWGNPWSDSPTKRPTGRRPLLHSRR